MKWARLDRKTATIIARYAGDEHEALDTLIAARPDALNLDAMRRAERTMKAPRRRKLLVMRYLDENDRRPPSDALSLAAFVRRHRCMPGPTASAVALLYWAAREGVVTQLRRGTWVRVNHLPPDQRVEVALRGRP